MNPNWSLKIFTVLASLAICVNLYLDYQSYRQTDLTSTSGRLVETSYQAVIAVDRIIGSYLDGSGGSAPKPAFIASLKQQVGVLPLNDIPVNDRQMLIAQLTSEFDRIGTRDEHPIAIMRLLREIRDREETALSQRRLADNLYNRDARAHIIEGTTADALLLVFLTLIFWNEWRNRQKNEKLLRSTIGQLQASNSALQILERERHTQIRTTVHDLKNPLGSIRGFAELLHEESANPKSVAELTEIIRRISGNTLHIVNSLLGDGAAPVETLSVSTAVREACEQLTPQMRAKNQEPRLEDRVGEARIVANPAKLRDALTNVISNAMKFSPERTVITVRAETHNGQVRIEVEDQGPGFTAGDRAKAFALNQKLSARPTGSESSTGVGLYAAKRSVESHGGKIEIVTPRQGSGACVRIELPLAPA